VLGRVNGHTNGFIQDSIALNIESDVDKEDSNGGGLNDIPVEIQYDANWYQTSLSTIIARMSEVVVSGDVQANKRPRYSQQHSDHLIAPSISNTISVEPLHFLGIIPTAEKAALLSTGSFILPLPGPFQP
jgi:hypothetical protein